MNYVNEIFISVISIVACITIALFGPIILVSIVYGQTDNFDALSTAYFILAISVGLYSGFKVSRPNK